MTTHKRWTVWRDRTLAALGDNPWVGAPEKHWQYRSPKHSFPTHAEAIAHADRMARTVKVTLPRVSNTTTDDLRAIALTLLAHTPHIEANKVPHT